MTALGAEEIRTRVESDFSRIVDVLNQKIALQSISAKGITADHMKRSAQFVADLLREVGVDTKVVQSHNPDGTPGAWEVIGSKNVSEDAPTVLLYAHHDVQPVPDPSVWNTDPFVGTEIDTRLYGRGAADDGGGIAIHSGALKALEDDLKVNIKVFIEGEEEMGSPSFIPFIEEHRDEFASDAIIVADSGNWSAEIPSLTTSLRGNTDIDVHVKALEHPVHSGQYGGPILDANTLAAMLISSMYVEGSFNVISPETTFRLSLRTAPNQRPEEAQEALAKFMVEHAPFGAEVWVDKLDNGMGWAMDPNAEATKDAMDAMEEAFGVAPVNKGEGGSIPFIPELQRIFPKAQVLVTGPEDPKANAHSPNESISLPALKNNVITEALLLDKLAK